MGNLGFGTKSVVLHIGLPKTATSAIQKGAIENQSILLDHSIKYVRTGQNRAYLDAGQHLLAVSLMRERWPELMQNIECGSIEELWRELRLEIDASDSSVFFISSELFSLDIVRSDQIKAIKNNLAGYRVEIVIVLRDIVDFLNSTYSARVYHGYAGSMEEYIWILWPHLRWKDLVAPWREIFGKESVMILNFDEVSRADFVQFFFNRALRIPEEKCAELQIETVNPSLNAASVDFIRSINSQLGAEAASLRDDVLSAIGRHEFYGGCRANFIDDGWARVLRRHCEWP